MIGQTPSPDGCADLCGGNLGGIHDLSVTHNFTDVGDEATAFLPTAS
jgi:hypothetical protein